MRLEKYLSDSTEYSRSEIKKLISSKKIKVDGQIVNTSVNVSENSLVELNGQKIVYTKYKYYILNKPKNCISANFDSNDKTVFDYIDVDPNKFFLFGRLDKDTEGLLIISNDGILSHKLLSPKKHVSKTYFVKTNRDIPANADEIFRSGVDIGEKRLLKPATFEFSTPDSGYITISEGKFHQIKRMFELLNCSVVELKRVSFGGLTLPNDLESGKWRELTKEEIDTLKNSVEE